MKVRTVKIYSNGKMIKFPDHVVSRSGKVFRWTDGQGTWKGKEMSVRYGGTHRYPRVTLGNEEMKKAYNLRLHQVVAHTFLGKPPNGYEIIYKDEDKQNSVLSNLKYGTRSENTERAYANGKIPPNRGIYGEDSPISHLNFSKIKRMFIMYYSKKKACLEVAQKFFISESLAQKVLRGYNWNYDHLSLEELKLKYLEN